MAAGDLPAGSATSSTPPIPEVEETIKRTVQPYFVLQGNVCALLAAKDHVNVFLYDGAIVPDPEGIITAGHDNKTARTVAFREGEPINDAGAHRDVPADHRQQPRRRLAQAQALAELGQPGTRAGRLGVHGVISIDDPLADDVRELPEAPGLAYARCDTAAPEDVHALQVEALLGPAVTSSSFRVDGELLGVAA